jgi:hypothetical protein
MSSLSVSNFIDITRSNDAPDSGSCHADYIQFSPSSWAPHQVGIRRRSICVAYFTGLSAVTGFVRAAGLLPPFLSAQFRCLPEIFRVLDKCISIGHARDVIGNLTYAL